MISRIVFAASVAIAGSTGVWVIVHNAAADANVRRPWVAALVAALMVVINVPRWTIAAWRGHKW